MDDVGGLALLPPERHRREIRTVRLDKKAIERGPRRNLLHRSRVLERHDAGEIKIEPESEGARRERAIFAEAVDDASHVSRPLALEDVERVAGRRPRMNDDGLVRVARERNQACEDVALGLARRVVVVVIETNRAYGRDVAGMRQTEELVVESRRPTLRIVGVKTHATGDVRGHAVREVHREPSGGNRVFRGLRLPCESYDDEANDAGVEGPLHHGIRPLGKVVGIEVAVRVRERKHRA